jgi:hypothetical protein
MPKYIAVLFVVSHCAPVMNRETYATQTFQSFAHLDQFTRSILASPSLSSIRRHINTLCSSGVRKRQSAGQSASHQYMIMLTRTVTQPSMMNILRWLLAIFCTHSKDKAIYHLHPPYPLTPLLTDFSVRIQDAQWHLHVCQSVREQTAESTCYGTRQIPPADSAR